MSTADVEQRTAMEPGDEVRGAPTETRDEHLEDERRRGLWCFLVVSLLGVWLASSPYIFGYDDPAGAAARATEVTAERGLSSVADRISWLTWSDTLSGLLLVVLGLASLRARWLWAPWAACFVGLWVSLAPILLWAPSAAAYGNQVLVGALVIGLTILVPGMPGMAVIMQEGPTTPPGWSYNPSSWWQRAPIIALGFVGWFFARWMAAYQLGHIDHVPDWFFGSGTVEILDSEVSRSFPVSDAGLGVFAYAVEALMGFMGGTDRWRTMPWMVTFFGILVIPLSAVSIFLIIMQPVAVGTWSTPALITAAAMLVMIPLTLDEVAAMGQFVLRRRREGAPLWRTFWKGDTIDGGGPDDRSPHYPTTIGRGSAAGLWGMTVPWTLAASVAVGIFFMAIPDVLGLRSTAASSTHLVGSLAVCVAVIAMAEVGRVVRYANIALGAWAIASTFVLSGGTTGLTLATLVGGAALIALALPRGLVRERYGTAQRFTR
ncbi:MAG: vitamin K epoxide reductase family protein [Acidimicrobiia bacterium]